MTRLWKPAPASRLKEQRFKRGVIQVVQVKAYCGRRRRDEEVFSWTRVKPTAQDWPVQEKVSGDDQAIVHQTFGGGRRCRRRCCCLQQAEQRRCRSQPVAVPEAGPAQHLHSQTQPHEIRQRPQDKDEFQRRPDPTTAKDSNHTARTGK